LPAMRISGNIVPFASGICSAPVRPSIIAAER
jgi:hypothetical protein